MVQLILGKKGKGKTKIVLEMVNKEITSANGNIVYLDKGINHMYELNNKIRLINVTEYGVSNADEFIGFIRGILSQDHDLEQVYFDSFLELSKLDKADLESALTKFEKISAKYNIQFVMSISVDESEVPESMKSAIIISL